MAGRSAKVRYLVRFQHHDGIAYSTGEREADSLWQLVEVAMGLIDNGFQLLGVERIVTRVEPLTTKEADAVRMLTGGKIDP